MNTTKLMDSQMTANASSMLLKNNSNDYHNNLEVLKEYRTGQSQEALEWLIINNTNLVHKIVGRYTKLYNHKLDYDDLFSVGLEGLMKAIDRFDLSFDNNFSTYATYWIKQAVTRTIADEGFTIRIPVHMFESINQVSKYEAKKSMVNQEIDVDDLLGELEIAQEKYDAVKRVQTYILKPKSLNGFLSRDDDDTELQDLITNDNELTSPDGGTSDFEAVEKRMMDQELQSHLFSVMRKLNEREQFVLTHRFGLYGKEKKTLEEIGEAWGVTRERIRQIEAKAMRKLRTLLVRYEGYFK
ncbi:MAG: RNA polymerase sigma factor RpoD/SigA [Turicibacter sp.]|nr:RNA polymerase sigma factor RpoD/SigA [Turicibacter sp.]